MTCQASRGAKAGFAENSTDTVGTEILVNAVRIFDWQVPIPHVLVLDQDRPTFRYPDRATLLTEVKGRVVREIFASRTPPEPR